LSVAPYLNNSFTKLLDIYNDFREESLGQVEKLIEFNVEEFLSILIGFRLLLGGEAPQTSPLKRPENDLKVTPT